MSDRASANQPPPLEPYNLFSADPVLRDVVEREGGGVDVDGLVWMKTSGFVIRC